MKNSKTVISIVIVSILVLFSIATIFWNTPITYITDLAEQNRGLSAIFFTLLIFIATVLAPVTATPAIPIAASILSPFLVAVLSIVGWGAGAVVAFVIARKYGKPLLTRFIEMGELQKYENKIPKRLEFLTLILMRMVMPVDILSYVVGLFSSMRLGVYTAATLIGIAPFAFIFAYGGSAFFDREYAFLLFLIGVGIALLIIVWRVLQSSNKN